VNRLTLNLNGEYFDQIKAGDKTEEYRLCNEYWRKRIYNRDYEELVIRRGYPKAGDPEREIVLPWRGYRVTSIIHPHFGNSPVRVIAIRLTGE
jgi:hypothetical protein